MVRSLIPWRETLPRPFNRIEEEMERMMNRFFPEDEWWRRELGFIPHANLAETENEFEVTVELPGLKPEEVHVDLVNDELWISGKREEEEEVKGKTYHRVERQYGEFRRVIRLPGAATVDPEKVEAKFEHGMLKVTVPKTEKAKTKHIEVKT